MQQAVQQAVARIGGSRIGIYSSAYECQSRRRREARRECRQPPRVHRFVSESRLLLLCSYCLFALCRGSGDGFRCGSLLVPSLSAQHNDSASADCRVHRFGRVTYECCACVFAFSLLFSRAGYPDYDGVPNFNSFSPFAGWTSPAMKQFQGDASVCGADVDLSWYP